MSSTNILPDQVQEVLGNLGQLPEYRNTTFLQITEKVTFPQFLRDLSRANGNQFISRPIAEESWASACRTLADTAFGVSKDVTSTGPKDLVLFEAFSQVESCPNWKAESFWAAASEQAKLQGVNLDISPSLDPERAFKPQNKLLQKNVTTDMLNEQTQLLSISTARQDKQDMTVATATMKLDGEKMDVEMGGNTAAPALPTARRVMDVDEDYSEFDIE